MCRGLSFADSALDSQLRYGKECAMGDVVFLGVTVVFFAVAWAYTLGCDRL